VKVVSAGVTPQHTHGIWPSGDDGDCNDDNGGGGSSDGIALVGASLGKGQGLAN